MISLFFACAAICNAVLPLWVFTSGSGVAVLVAVVAVGVEICCPAAIAAAVAVAAAAVLLVAMSSRSALPATEHSTCTMRASLASTAKCSGVLPKTSTAFTSAPAA
eukprot:TRINITY_DN9114_c0_g1_i3.p1 TRINITY_DN9114_c0_g1~~TRINITY_DN9114_c0_g1_i3.p1  ORF type:complete len:106 (+),score=16.67 TRINITY_DN9114_c0_g1_i3:83-400(+)